jgi:sterol desaturase/sphingolipid hydroxylase (fatty acid hydroxylase superfamily)
MIIEIAVFILCYDIWFYIFHVILHKYFYASIHKLHHSVPHEIMTYEHTNNGHLIENIISPLGQFVPFYFYEINQTTIINFLIASSIIGIRALLRHDNRCSWIIGNHHILHHKHLNCNYGEYWLDCVFDTCHNEKN